MNGIFYGNKKQCFLYIPGVGVSLSIKPLNICIIFFYVVWKRIEKGILLITVGYNSLIVIFLVVFNSDFFAFIYPPW